MRRQILAIILALGVLGLAGAQGNVVPVPAQISPGNGAVLHDSPRILIMTWRPVPQAAYEVQVDCRDCRQVGRWDSEVGPPFILQRIEGPSARMEFWGDNLGRWRVRAVLGSLFGAWSPWWEFRYETGRGGATVDLSARIGGCPREPVKPGQALGASFKVRAVKVGSVPVTDVAIDIVLRKTAACPSPAPFAVYSANYSDGVLLLGGREHISMAAAESAKAVVLNGQNTIPADTPPGEYELCAVVDAGNKVAETNERNNCACCRITVGGAARAGVPCGVRLDKLSRTSGKPGDTYEMFGEWGSDQGAKLPCINMGGMNKLIVLRWTPSVLLVRIPNGLAPGKYKTGVYCSDPAAGTTYSSGWLDFEILAVLPDLVPKISFVKVKAGTDASGNPYWIFNVIIKVTNSGGSAAGPFKVYLERNIGPGGAYANACQTCTIEVAGLAAGATAPDIVRQFNNANNYPSLFRATADYGNNVAESNEGNNMDASAF